VFALVAVDGLRERIQVTALPLNAAALLSRASGSAAEAAPVVAVPEASPAVSAPPLAAVPAARVTTWQEMAAPESELLAPAATEPSTEQQPAELVGAAPSAVDDAQEQADGVPATRVELAPTAPRVAVAPVSTRATAARPRRVSPAAAGPRTDTASAALDLDELPDDLDVPENPDEVRELREQARAERVASASPSSAVTGESTPAASKPVAAAPAKPRTRTKTDPALQRALAEAQALSERNELSALAAYRRLGREYPKEPRVLEGWSRIAASTKWWGESLRVAEAWAALDSSTPAQIHLARTQKRLGQVERAIATLQALLAKQPRESEASNLLQLYGGASVALR
jgi:hypothetical protein